MPDVIAQRGRRAVAGRLFGATISALLGTSALVAPAYAGPPPLFTSAWLNARSAASGGAAAAASAALAGATPTSIASVEQSMADLRRAANALAIAQAAQAQARQTAAAAASTVPNGLMPGGLVPVPGAAVNTPNWSGANLPTQSVAGGQTTVSVQQTAAQALLHWSSFNVGRNTRLAFDQSAGGSAANTWVAVNEIQDPSQNPTQILGSITAPGRVYIINPNGVIFGATSQVNVGALVASTATIAGGDAQFLQTGLFGSTQGGINPSFVGATGSIMVDAGAQITTNAPTSPLSTGGFVLLLGQSVQNAGSIVTADGQTALAAGQNFILQPGFSEIQTSSGTTGNTTATVLGNEIAVTNGGSVLNTGVISASTGDISLVGHAVAQNGILLSTTSAAQRGTIHLLTDTSDQTATVVLGPNSVTSITLDPNSGEEITSTQQANVAASASADANRIAQGESGDLLNDQVVLPDRQDLSRVEITTGGLVDFQSGSLTLATGGQVAVSARYIPATGNPVNSAGDTTGRIFVETGAVIDVSGAMSASLPASANAVAVSVEPFDLRDAPVNRDTGVLSAQTAYIDQQQLVPLSGTTGGVTTYAATRLYTPGGLLEVSGEVGNIEHGIGEFDSVGGTITLSSAQVVAQPGAIFDIAGGAINYQPGYVPTTWLIGSNGRLFNINTAPTNVQYTGVYDGFAEEHTRWAITDTYFNGLLAPSETYEAGYTVGRDAGALLLSTPTAVFQGEIDAGVIEGQRQTRPRSAGLTEAFLQPQDAVPQAGTLALGDFDALANVFPTSVTIGATVDATASTLTPTAALAAHVTDTAYFSAADLSGFGLGGVSVAVGAVATTANAAGTVEPGNDSSVTLSAPLNLQPGATVSFGAGVVSVQAPIVARGGAILVSTQGSINTQSSISPVGLSSAGRTAIALGATATLDVRGIWTNALTGGPLTNEAFVNGGTVSIDSASTLDLAAGSTIEASAGAALLPAGKKVAGLGGSVTLIGDDPLYSAEVASAPSSNRSQPVPAPVIIDTVLAGIGVSRGGTLVLEAPEVAIGDGLLPADDYQVVLPTSFFQNGFAGYAVEAFGTGASIVPPQTGSNRTNNYVNLSDATVPSLTVAPGAQVIVAEPTYQFTAASQLIPSGSDPASALQATLLPEYVADPTRATFTQRPGASLNLQAAFQQNGTYSNGGAVDIGPGSLIQVDSGQSINVSAYNQLTVDGTLRAPGGTISLLNDRQEPNGGALTYVPGLSVWIGSGATLDAAGGAFIARDIFGNPFGTAEAGGNITIGAIGSAGQTSNPVISTDAAVIIRPGATLDVSGTSTAIDLAAGSESITGVNHAATQVATDAGTISLSSYTGIYPYGTIRAFAGGASAQGGLLAVTLETPVFSSNSALPAELVQPHEIVFSQTADPSALPATLTPGDPSSFTGANLGLFDKAELGVNQITADGFTRLSIFTHDIAMFQGSVSLDLGQSFTLQAPAIVDSSPSATVNVFAPYLLLGSPTALSVAPEGQASFLVVNYGTGVLDSSGVQGVAFSNIAPCRGLSTGCVSATLNLGGDLVDIQNTLRFAVDTTIGASTLDILPTAPKITLDLPGFADVNITSSGDIRFLASPSNGVSVAASGDLTLSAAQLYPVTPAASPFAAQIDAGVTVVPKSFTTSIDPLSVLTIRRSTDSIPAGPLSTFGTIEFGAATVDQGGIVRAPEGQIDFGGTAFNPSVQLVNLLPGSVTSVSANGLDIPFGGTTSGTEYSYDGTLVLNPGTVAGTAFTLVYGVANTAGTLESTVGITAEVNSLNISRGATVDLSGGGTLSGGGGEYVGGGNTLVSQGFITGRGGSTDTLVTPFVTFSGGAVSAPALQQGTAAAASTVGVFAVVPGFSSAYAPVTGFDQSGAYYGSLPTAGEQITLPAGTAGLPAGTYTLLPSYYALLPGGYRVQFGQAPITATTPTGALGNGSFVTAGYVGYANTGAQSSLPTSVTVTPGTTARTYSQYDEEDYAQFVTTIVTQFGSVRPRLPQDAKKLLLDFFTPPLPQNTPSALIDAGTVLFGPAPGGYGGTAIVTAGTNGNRMNLEITSGLTPTAGFVGASVASGQIDNLGAAELEIGSVNSSNATGTVVIRSGAYLAAPEIDIPLHLTPTGGAAPALLVIEPGATLSTLGQGPAPVIPSRGNNPAAGTGTADLGDGLFLANGGLTLDPASTLIGSIDLGSTCLEAAGCGSSAVSLLTDGALIIAGDVAQGSVQFGAQSFTVFVPILTLSNQASTAQGGFTLSESTISKLAAGSVSAGVPALQQLTLDASAVNIVGPFNLDTINAATGQSSLAQLVLQTPVINGEGAAGDVATITTGTFVWSGVSVPAPVATGAGLGTLDIVANQIVFGYPAGSAGASNIPVDRTIGGFSVVNLTGSSEITSTNNGTLTVYQSAGAYVNGQGFVGNGQGALNLTTALLSGGAGSTLSIISGGPLTLQPPSGAAPSTVSTGDLGASVTLTAPSIVDNTAIVLPSGLVAMTAQTGDISLGSASRIVVSGPSVALEDQIEYNPGGSVLLQSAMGNVTQAAGGVIDVSSVGAGAGSLSVAALGQTSNTAGVTTVTGGNVALLGTLIGGGGLGGSIDVRAGTLSQDGFTALNQQLTLGGFFGSRSFETATGSLTIDDPAPGVALVQAHTVDISVDAGGLTVGGLIDASGAAPGVIRLASSGNLVLTGNAVLDAHGTSAQTTGLTTLSVDALNTGSVELAVASGLNGASSGTLTVQPGAVINVSAAAGVTCAYGPCGIVEFDAPRLGSATSGQIAISVPVGVTVEGAGTVDVNAFWNTLDASGVIYQGSLNTEGTVPSGSLDLDAVDRDNVQFIAAAESGGALNAGLQSTLGGIYSPGSTTFHLRPGVEITSGAVDGSLTIAGDLDLSKYRYQSVDANSQLTSSYGSGEPGVLVLRASGNLNVTGSINDGFGQATTLQTPDDQGWVLQSGTRLVGSVIVPPGSSVTLNNGTTFPTDVTLTFDVPLTGVSLAPGAAVPVLAAGTTATLSTSIVVQSSFVTTGTITVAGGPTYRPGSTVPAGTTLNANTVLGAGATLPASALAGQTVFLNNLTWPAGAALSALATAPRLDSTNATANLTLGAGTVLPAGMTPLFPKNASGQAVVEFRSTVNNAQGVVYGALPMLPASGAEPTLSWSLRMVAGANTAAADTRAVLPAVLLQDQATAANPDPGSITLSDLHFSGLQQVTGVAPKNQATETFSVVRTGTGYLDLIAGGNVAEDTLYGVYTAGSNAVSAAGAAYDAPRQEAFPASRFNPNSSVLGPTGQDMLSGGPTYEQLVQDVYQANYPQGGGDLLIDAQGSVAGDVVSYAYSSFATQVVPDSNAVGNWLWRQGGDGTATAWWINFGTYVTFAYNAGSPGSYQDTYTTTLIGFTGYGALGGGNATVVAGANAGYGIGGTETTAKRTSATALESSSALDIAVADTGRVDPASGAVTYAGGGDVVLDVGGMLNPTGLTPQTVTVGANTASSPTAGLFGTLTDLRGDLTVSAGSIGSISPPPTSGAVTDPRALPADAQEEAAGLGGPVVVPGESSVDIFARSDLVLTGAGDPTRETEQSVEALTTTEAAAAANVQESWFTLWQPSTSITLRSAGGDVVPIVEPAAQGTERTAQRVLANGNATATDYRYVYPPILDVTSETGSIYIQRLSTYGSTNSFATALETAPSASGFIDFIAGQSIYANAANPGDQARFSQQNIPVDVSGADPGDEPTAQAPAWRLSTGLQSDAGNAFTSNLSADGHSVFSLQGANVEGLPLFAFEPDTASPSTHAVASATISSAVSRFYAVAGDVVDLQLGELLTFPSTAGVSPSVWEIGGEAVRVVAGGDIVESGTTPEPAGANGVPPPSPLKAPDVVGATSLLTSTTLQSPTPTGNLVVNANTSDVSEIAAGRDVIYLNTDIAGPGQILIQAGRNLYQGQEGILESLGVIDRTASSAGGGAGITVIAGAGAAGPDYTAFADLYFDPANLADPSTPIQDQPGKVPETYQAQLLAYLQQNFGYAGSAADALSYFLNLPPADQATLVLPTFYDELNQAGLNYNDPSSPFYRTYVRGNLAIATLLPLYGSTGYSGAATLFGGSGIRTDYGGDIQMLIPGGGVTLGISASTTPPATSGVITQGSGNIDIYSEGSVLLGQSRVLTTYGGSILIWARQGDINAGIGSKSTVLSTPVGITYDQFGDITLSPTVPSTGAGIGSLAPIPSVPAGDVNLIAPEGTIDAGEAGIRSSGNANLAALAVVNASNIQVKGSTTGVPTVQAPNLGALAAASAVAGAQQQAATAAAQASQPKQSDSIITVEVIGFGS